MIKKTQLVKTAKKSPIKQYNKLNKKDIVQLIIKLKVKEKISNYSLINILQSTPYNYSLTQCYRYIKKANLTIAEIYKDWNINALEEALNDLSEQKEAAKIAEDRKLILEITKEENKLKGLYTEKINLSIEQVIIKPYEEPNQIKGSTSS